MTRRRAPARARASATTPPDAPAEIADAVSALRLTTAAAVAAGPVLFETLDGRPFGIQPVLPIAATQPPGESSRLDSFRTPIAVDVLAALGDADGDPELADALDRWELSLFQNEPFRGEQLRAALASLLGDTWPMRGCVLLGEDRGAREELYGELDRHSRPGEPATTAAVDAARRAIVAVLRSRDRDRLVHDLDRELLGLDRQPGSARRRRLDANSSSARSRYPCCERGGATVGAWTSRKAMLERLERIEALDRAGAAPAELVDELRALLVEAEAWSRPEGGDAGAARRRGAASGRWSVT